MGEEIIMKNGFWNGKRVLITGHTGFKGSWMTKVLLMLGAEVTGYALEPPTTPSIFECVDFKDKITSIIGDIKDLSHLSEVFVKTQPEIVMHMAAQPLVRESYQNPVYTYDVNVMGTVNVLECIRNTQSVKSFVNVTTDKVYLNKEWEWGYRENEELNGQDPYSNSKSCSELVTSSYVKSFFSDRDVAISTVRAGNVVGGGDFAKDRIIPDCIRAAQNNESIVVRNPFSVRPYQHVLEPVMAYLLLAQKQYEDKAIAGNYNVGPDEADCLTTGELADLFCIEWKKQSGKAVTWESQSDILKNADKAYHEANYLRLDCSKIKKVLQWKPRWQMNIAMEKIVEWTLCYQEGGNIEKCMENQIEEFLGRKPEASAKATLFEKFKTGGKRFVIDIDGVIAKFDPNLDYASADPNEPMIKAINKLYDMGNEIIIFTARGYVTGKDWRTVTEDQFARWGLKYHELHFGKPNADYYVDDKMLDMNVLLEVVGE